MGSLQQFYRQVDVPTKLKQYLLNQVIVMKRMRDLAWIKVWNKFEKELLFVKVYVSVFFSPDHHTVNYTGLLMIQ